MGTSLSILKLTALALACLCVPAAADIVAGVVTSEGKPLRDARVTARAWGLRARTDSLGRYALEIQGTSLAWRGEPPAFGGSAPAGLARFRGRDAAAWVRADGRFAAPAIVTAELPALARGAAVPAGPELSIQARGHLDRKVMVPTGQAKADAALERDRRRHLWIWETAAITQAAVRESLFTFARRKGVGTFYANAAGILGAEDKALAGFLDAAAADGFQVELLFGAPEWALAAGHFRAINLARQAKALTLAQDAKLAAPPAGVQFDVEPYALDAYKADPQALGSQWVDMYVAAGAAMQGAGISLTACIPRWLETRPVTRAGRSRPLNEWLADATDRLTLMDYVDKAKGIIEGAEVELAYAEAHGKEVVVGLETLGGLDPASVTFAEEGEAALEAAHKEAEPVFRGYRAYYGTAIHHWRSYEILKP